MIKKALCGILLLCLALLLFNYDRTAVFFCRHMPACMENYLAEGFMPEKFWLHRVNSVDKQKELAGKYSGLEFDIIYHGGERKFENSHDAEDLQLYNLEKQFQQYELAAENNGLWLDFKNLTEQNKEEALAALTELLDKYHIDKNKIWVESGNWQALGRFKQAGFRTSYYLPYYKFEKMTAAEIEKAKRETERIAASGNVDAVSFYGKYYSFVSGLKLPGHIAFLSWLNERNWYEALLLKKYAAIRNDERVKVILVRDTGHYSR